MKSFLLNSIAVCFGILISCKSDTRDSRLKSENDSIVVVFKKNPLANSAQEGHFYTRNFVRYFDANFIEIQKELKNKTTDDTLKIGIRDEFYPISLFHNYIYFNYLLKKGDTVVFDFTQDDIPNVAILNRDASALERNFPVFIKKRFKKALKDDGMIYPMPKNRPSAEMRFNSMYVEFNDQNKFIDSLLEKKLVNRQLANYYKDELKANLYGDLKFKDISPYLLNKIPADTINAFINRPDLLKAGFFQAFLKHRYIWSDILGIETINLSHGRTLNYAMAYDKFNTNLTNPVVREYLLFYCLSKIKEEGTKATYNSYLTKFKAVNKNGAYLDALNSDEINNNINLANDEITIADINGRQYGWNNFIQSARGKVIYVDFWASWCGPCRAAMPAAKKLKTHYANESIVFAYLSIDAKKDDWLKAAGDENLKTDQNSFLLLNPKESSLTVKLNLKSIPRYLIYNKKGELVNANAPAPDSPQLKELLDQYLSAK